MVSRDHQNETAMALQLKDIRAWWKKEIVEFVDGMGMKRWHAMRSLYTLWFGDVTVVKKDVVVARTTTEVEG